MKTFYHSLLCGSLVAAALFKPAAVIAQQPALISRTPRVSDTAAGPSQVPIFSRDGRSLFFISAARNLVTNDNLAPSLNVYRHDIPTHALSLVSVNASGTGGGNVNSFAPSVSSNGLVVAFQSTATNLVPGDANGLDDIFLRSAAAMVSVSTNLAGTNSGTGVSRRPAISGDGRFVAFETKAVDLFASTNSALVRSILHDTLTGQRRSIGADPNGDTASPVLSHDGRFTAYLSFDKKAVPVVSNEVLNTRNRAFLMDNTTDEILCLSCYVPWQMTNYFLYDQQVASSLAMTPDGRYVTYMAGVLQDEGWGAQPPAAVVRYDRLAPMNTLPWRWHIAHPMAESLSISDDGRYITFAVFTTNGPVAPGIYRIDMERSYPCDEWGACTNCPDNTCYGALELVTLADGGTNAASGSFRAPAASADGQRIAFVSDSMNLVAGLTQTRPRLYLRDMAASNTVLICDLGTGLDTTTVALNTDGTLVAFDSESSGIVPNDRNGASDVFLHDTATGITRLVSARAPALPGVTSSGVAPTSARVVNGIGSQIAFLAMDGDYSDYLNNSVMALYLADRRADTLVSKTAFTTNTVGVFAQSANGRYAMVETTILGDGPSYYLAPRVHRVNLLTSEVEPVSVTLSGAEVAASQAAMSADGRRVVFVTGSDVTMFASGIAVGGFDQVVVRDFGDPALPTPVQPRHIVASVNTNTAAPGPGNNHSFWPSISPDGRWVAFTSLAKDISAETTQSRQIYARDLENNVTRWTGPTWTGLPTNIVFSPDSRRVAFQTVSSPPLIQVHDLFASNYSAANSTVPLRPPVCTNCSFPSLSADGRFVAYLSPASNTTFTAPWANVYVADTVTGTNWLISKNLAGTGGGNGHSSTPLITADGRFVAFTSRASNLVANDTNGVADVFVHDRWLGVTRLVSRSLVGDTTGDDPSLLTSLSADGRTLVFQSFASDLIAGDFNQRRDVFVFSLTGGDTDADGLDDGWEMAYFNTLSSNGSGDTDGDGVSDAAEFRAGTDPNNRGSILLAQALTRAGAGTVAEPSSTTLSWAAVLGRTYRVQFKAELGDPAWTDLPGDVVSGGGTAAKTHTRTNGPPDRAFYRVLVVE